MTARMVLLASAGALWSVAAVLAAEISDTRVYECVRAGQAPVIDGKLDDACWRQASKTDQFVRIISGPEVIQQTLFQVAYDDGHLYLGVTCLEADPEAIQATVRTADLSGVMGDDAVEIFVRPDLNEPDYYQFAANSLGTRYDGKAFDAGWNADWQAAASVGEDAWYLECTISFASLGRFGVAGAVWGFNVNRDRQAGGDTEWSGWSDTMGGFHTPARFGSLIFGGQPGRVDRALLIECAAYAKHSIELEARLNEHLRTVREGGLEFLTKEERQRVEPTVDAAEQALGTLKELIAGDSALDLEAWMKVMADLRAAAKQVGEVAWTIRFARLLADD